MIDRDPPAERAAQQRDVDGHTILSDSEDLRGESLDAVRSLCADPDLAAIVADVGDAIEWFHCGVRLKRRAVRRLETRRCSAQCGRGVAFVSRDFSMVERCLELEQIF